MASVSGGDGVSLIGLDDLIRKMNALPEKLARQAANKATRAGAAIIVREIKSRAPVRTGAIRRNVVQKAAPKKSGIPGHRLIGVQHGKVRTSSYQITLKSGRKKTVGLSAYDKRGEDPFYYVFQELGFTAVGRRKAATRAVRQLRKLGAVAGGRRIPGKFFIRNGFNAGRGPAFEKIREVLAKELERIAAKK